MKKQVTIDFGELTNEEAVVLKKGFEAAVEEFEEALQDDGERYILQTDIKEALELYIRKFSNAIEQLQELFPQE